MRIGIVGCAGRMGRALTREAFAAGASLVGGTERPGSPAVGRDLGLVAGLDPLNAPVLDDVDALFAASDVVLDFTTPAATALHAEAALRHQAALIVGTTGLDADVEAKLDAAAARVPVVVAANYSVGVNLLSALVERAAAVLGTDYDIEIVEMHHKHKVDAPSGTALVLGRSAAKGRGVRLEDVWVKSRDGITGPRVGGTIGFATLRGGDVVGDHNVVFAGEGERLELGHRASDRGVLAKGAVRAALWVEGKPAGRYSMRDVLGL